MQSLEGLPEAFVSTNATSGAVLRAVRAGRLRKLGSRLYTSNVTDPPERIVKRNLWRIVAGYFPGALVADRTALENAPAPDGTVCVISPRGNDIELPEIILRPRRGIGPLASDRPFLDGLFLSSPARAWLENMRPSRGRGGRLPRTLPRLELEKRLDTLIRRGGAEGTNRLRDEIRAVAPELGLQAAAEDLDRLIGGLLGTGEVSFSSSAARARARGRPYDPDRADLFQALHTVLRNHPPMARPARARTPDGEATLAFYEAYFSNFIEGTEFEVQEAADIVFGGAMPTERPADAHDVLGTWAVVSSEREMSRTAGDIRMFRDLLMERHARIMQGRPEMGPGRFKTAENRAGGTHFVTPDLVEGTLERGFDFLRSLETPFQRAVFVKFLIAEVHPFADGNGRLSRVMMNAELVAAGEERIVIPTAFRNNYLSALRVLSRNENPEPLIQALDYAQRWTRAMDWSDISSTERRLEACNAFPGPDEAEEIGRPLRFPNPTVEIEAPESVDDTGPGM